MNKTLDVVIPVLNEEQALSHSIAKLHKFLEREFDRFSWQIIIADNGSTDSTPDIGNRLSVELPCVSYIHLDKRGRGRALRTAWQNSTSDIVSYMDLDLSTDLGNFPALIDAIDEEGYDIAIGSRIIKGSVVTDRSVKRELASRAYSYMFRAMFLTGFHDAQCGFKALNRRVVDEVLPLVRNVKWFFDTELLVIAEKRGFRIKEIPVRWTDDPDSKVRIIGTAYEDIRGLLRLRFVNKRRI